MAGLTHFDAGGAARWSTCRPSPRPRARAVAARLRSPWRPRRWRWSPAGRAAKGDVLGVARLAGIMAAKRTADLIPLCHPLPLDQRRGRPGARSGRRPGADRGHASRTTGQTGVEMEALTAVSVAALTVYDMLKAVDRGMVIGEIRLVLKDGGKSGRYEAP